MRTLLTGASGFVGMNLCIRLLQAGESLVLVDRNGFPEKYKEILAEYGSSVQYVQGDLLDKDSYTQLEGLNIDAIINAAVMTLPDLPEEEAFAPMAETNLVSQIRLLEFARRQGIKRFLYVSSSGVYGSASSPGEWVHEESKLDLFSTYCITKYASELLLAEFGRLNGVQCCVARIAAPYGPFERVTPSRVKMSQVYAMVHMALEGQEAVIYGRNVVRDWTYIKDTVEIIFRLHQAENLHYPVYNTSCAVSSSLEDIAKAVQAAVPGFRYRFTDCLEEANVIMRPESQRGNLDIQRIREDIQFAPAYDLVKGVAEYVRFLS